MSRSSKRTKRGGATRIDEHDVDHAEEEQKQESGNTAPTSSSPSLTSSQLDEPRINNTHPLQLYYCLRHPISAAVADAAASSLASPAAAARFSSRAADSSSASVAITQPLHSSQLGIRQILFTHHTSLQQQSMIVASASRVWIWKMRDWRAKQTRRSPSIAAAADANWSCQALIDISDLPITLDASNSHCPWQRQCVKKEETLAAIASSRSSNINDSRITLTPDTSTSFSAASPPPPSMLLRLSEDESQLFIIVNAMLATPQTSISTTAAAAAGSHESQTLLLSAASEDVAMTSPAISAATPSPFQSSRARIGTAARGSPPIASGTGSQGLEADFDAMFDQLDQPMKNEDHFMTQQSTATQPTQASVSVASTPNEKKGASKTKRVKKGTPAVVLPPILTPYHAVYVLQLSPPSTSSLTSCSPSPPVPSRTSQPSGSPSLTGSQYLDSMMDEMMNDCTPVAKKEAKTPKSKLKKIVALSALPTVCEHPRLLFTTQSGITACLTQHDGSLLIGDCNGVISQWKQQQQEQKGAWSADVTFDPLGVHSALKSISAAPSSSITASNSSSFIAVHENGSIVLWQLYRREPIKILTSHLTLGLTQPPHPATPPRQEEMKSEPRFVVSPTTSTPSSSAPSTPLPMQKNLPAGIGGTGSEELLIPETQFTPSTRSGALSTLKLSAQNDEATSTKVENGIVHSVIPIYTSKVDSVRFLMILSPPASLTSHDVPSDHSANQDGTEEFKSASQSSTVSRRSARKAAATPTLMIPPLPCPATLPSMISIEFNLNNDDDAPPHLELFRVPLLLSDDNPSVHTTSISASVMDASSWQQKNTLFKQGASASSSSASASLPVYFSSGLSSGALVIHSAHTNRMTAIMTDASGASINGEEVNPDSVMNACDILLNDTNLISAPLTLRNELISLAQPSPSARRRSAAQSPIPTSKSSPRIPASSSSPLISPKPIGRKRKSASRNDEIPTATAALVNTESHDRSMCPSCLPPSSSTLLSRRHICTRAVTCMTFHSTWNLLAVGDQQGHVHIYSSATAASSK